MNPLFFLFIHVPHWSDLHFDILKWVAMGHSRLLGLVKVTMIDAACIVRRGFHEDCTASSQINENSYKYVPTCLRPCR